MKIELKKIGPMELPDVLEVLEESTTFTRAQNIGELRPFAESLFIQERPGIDEDNHILFSILNNGKNLGFINLWQHFPLPGFVQLDLMVLKEDYQGQGIGSQVLDQLKALCLDNRLKTLWLKNQDESYTKPFWKAKGFIKDETGRLTLQLS